MKKIIISVIAIITLYSLQAQESLIAHFDKPFYVSGDIVSYDIKLPSSFAGSEVAFNNYIADSQGNVLLQYFTNNKKKTSFNGYFTIPYSWVSDIYQLVIAGQDKTTGAEINIAKVDIRIYNDISADPMDFSSIPMETLDIDNKISVNSSKAAYSPREKVSLTVNAARMTDASVVVVDKKLINAKEGLKVANVINQATPDMLNGTPYLTGRVVDSNGNPMKLNVLGVYDAKTRDMLYSKSGIDGSFQLGIDSYVGNKKLHLHPYLFGEAEALSVTIKKNTGTKASSAITIDSTVINYIQASRDRKKIYQQFGKVENQLKTIVPQMVQKELKANRSFKIGDYQSFENVAAFFNEILASELSFVLRDDGKLKARMYNPKNRKNSNRDESSYFEKDPIFIIDNKITQDADKIGRLPLDNITSVDLYYKVDDIRKDFGTFGGSAYAIVHTTYPNFLLDDEEEEDIISWNGYLPKLDQISIPIEAITADEPIFKSVLFYDAEVLSQDGQIQFNSGDDISDYEVLVIGQNSSGQVISGSTTFKVSY